MTDRPKDAPPNEVAPAPAEAIIDAMVAPLLSGAANSLSAGHDLPNREFNPLAGSPIFLEASGVKAMLEGATNLSIETGNAVDAAPANVVTNPTAKEIMDALVAPLLSGGADSLSNGRVHPSLGLNPLASDPFFLDVSGVKAMLEGAENLPTNSDAARAREISIMANSSVQQPLAAEPEASLRANLLDKLSGAEAMLQAAIEQLSGMGDSPALAQYQASLSTLARLQANVANATPAALAAISAEVTATVAAAATSAQQARSVTSGADAADGATLAGLATRAQAQGAAFMRDLGQYNHLLQFDTTAEQEAYRQREDERRRRYDAEAAKGTPEGTLNANGAALGQMADLAVHGGNADPALMRRMDELATSTAALREKIIQDGGDVVKFDEGLRTDLRQIMRSKGIADDKIDALLAEHRDNPINAMKAYVAESGASLTQRDVETLNVKIFEHKDDAITPAELANMPAGPAPKPDHFASAATEMAKLMAVGVVPPPSAAIDAPEHGVMAVADLSVGRTSALS